MLQVGGPILEHYVGRQDTADESAWRTAVTPHGSLDVGAAGAVGLERFRAARGAERGLGLGDCPGLEGNRPHERRETGRTSGLIPRNINPRIYVPVHVRLRGPPPARYRTSQPR